MNPRRYPVSSNLLFIGYIKNVTLTFSIKIFAIKLIRFSHDTHILKLLENVIKSNNIDVDIMLVYAYYFFIIIILSLIHGGHFCTL